MSVGGLNPRGVPKGSRERAGKAAQTKRKDKGDKKMKYFVIYRVVGETGPYVSAWVLSKYEAKRMLKELQEDVIFGEDKYHIEESSLVVF